MGLGEFKSNSDFPRVDRSLAGAEFLQILRILGRRRGLEGVASYPPCL